MKLEQAQLWLGTQASYEAVVEALAKQHADTNFKASDSYEEEVMRQMYNVQDGVATVRISGSLVNGTAGYGVYYGITGYDDIRNALVKAVSNQNVSAIVLDVSSGGGHVAGCHETAQLIARVAKVKPVVTYTGSMMGSAAVWTGASASYVVAGETAIVGSIGIIMVHMERSKMLEEMGVKATVIRAGAEKALASPYEPLSEKAKENMEAQAAALYDIFIKHVAESRGVSLTTADTKFGQGKEFLGKAALAAGLVDKVGTYEDAFSKAMQLGAAASKGKKGGVKAEMLASPVATLDNSVEVSATLGDNAANASDNQATSQGNPMTKPLTQEQLAAMAAGVDLSEVPETPEVKAESDEPEEASDSSAQTEQAPDALAVVQDLLKSANADLVTAKLEAKTAQDALAASADQLEKFAAIARASVKTMGLHFGVKSDAVAAMDNATVLAEHARLADLFKEKFKVGGVAATSEPEKNSTKASFMAPALAAVAMSLPGAK